METISHFQIHVYFLAVWFVYGNVVFLISVPADTNLCVCVHEHVLHASICVFVL